MRLNVHDFSGHPFQVHLSRALAKAGHQVLHGYSDQYVTGRGRLEVTPDDPATLRIEGLTAAAPMVKYHPLGRARFELSYAAAWQAALRDEQHDVVVVSNVPLLALARMRRYFEAHRQPWVLWHQDLYSLGVGAEALRRLPVGVSHVARNWAERLEQAQVRDADAVVAITDRMVQQYRRWGIHREQVHVILNWAPLDEVSPGKRDNEWARRVGLPEGPLRLMYAGTLGRKHNPMLLLEMLDAVQARGIDAYLVVVSEGVGADDLRAATTSRGDVKILDYQPAADVSAMLAAADAVVALLEPDAAEFSVPSKVLTYLAAGRPVVALLPINNPAGADVASAGGFVAEPTLSGAQRAATWLADLAVERDRLVELGARARSFAEQRFDIDRISREFDDIFTEAARKRFDAPLAVVAAPENTAAL